MMNLKEGYRQPSIKVSSKSFSNPKGQNDRQNSEKLKKRTASIPDELTSPGKVGSDAINSTDIQNLAVKEQDLKKLHLSLDHQPSDCNTKPEQTFKYAVKTHKALNQEVNQTKKIVVARNAPFDAELKPIDYSGPCGPRYNHQNGKIIQHSLVGSVEDFLSQALKQHYITPESQTVEDSSTAIYGEINIKPNIHRVKKKTPQIPTAMNQANALLNWQRKMAERKRLQGHISTLLQKPIDRLAMNQDGSYREIQEMRHLVNRAIPAVDYGKGYRVGSEFWKQHESFGDDLTGIKMTLTKTERGNPVEFEHVRKPAAVLQEIGIAQIKDDEKTVNPSCQWRSNEYLKERWRQLEPIMQELDPYNMDISEIQVIGKPCNKENFSSRNYSHDHENYQPLKSQSQAKYDNREMECDDPLEKYPDVVEQPVFGPSIIFGGFPAKWIGSSNANVDDIGHISRVFFESHAGEHTTSHLEVKNNGTTATYYDWRKVTTPPSFECSRSDVTQRFYFNTSEGVILPDESKHFPFVFKSPNPGIFTETWQLLTEPAVLGGASLQVVLKGISTERDVKFEERNRFLKALTAKQAEASAKRIIDDIVWSIRTPDRSPSPVDAYVTEEDLFKRKNPGCRYDYETVLELKNFYLQLFPEESQNNRDWNLSLTDLKDCIVAVPDENVREELLVGLNTVVRRLATEALYPSQNQMYSAGYQILLEIIDGVCSCSMRIRGIMGLPEIIMEPILDTETSAVAQQPMTDAKAKSMFSEYSAGNSRRDDKKAKGGKKSTGKEDPKGKAKGKKDAKEKERPKSKDPKGGKGKAATPTKEISSMERDISSKTPSSVRAAPDSLDPVTRKKYTEKLYSQVYDLLCVGIEEMIDIFEEIKKS